MNLLGGLITIVFFGLPWIIPSLILCLPPNNKETFIATSCITLVYLLVTSAFLNNGSYMFFAIYFAIGVLPATSLKAFAVYKKAHLEMPTTVQSGVLYALPFLGLLGPMFFLINFGHLEEMAH